MVTPVPQEHYMSIQQHRPPLRSVDHDAKLRTAAQMLPSLLGPAAAPSGLHPRMPNGAVIDNLF